jgi:type IV pilus assembly protein PilA
MVLGSDGQVQENGSTRRRSTMMRILRKEKGFTLIELMIVVAIIGILAAIAIPNFLRFQAKSKQSEAKTNLGALGTTAEAYRAEFDHYRAAWNDLGWSPQGSTRYSYYYRGTDGGGALTSAGSFGAPGKPAAPCVPADPTTTTGNFVFEGGASGQIDSDTPCDDWVYNEQRVLTNSNNDVG